MHLNFNRTIEVVTSREHFIATQQDFMKNIVTNAKATHTLFYILQVCYGFELGNPVDLDKITMTLMKYDKRILKTSVIQLIRQKKCKNFTVSLI